MDCKDTKKKRTEGDSFASLGMTRVQDGFRQEVHQFALHQPLDRTGAVGRLVAVLDHVVLEGRGEDHRDAVLGQLVTQVFHLDVEDVADIGLGERVEHDDLVDSVQELRTDRLLEDVQHLVAALVQQGPAPRDGLGIDPVHLRQALHVALDDVRAGIGGHDEDGVLEVAGRRPAPAGGR